MATYAELFDLRNDSSLRNRVAVAITVSAEAIRTESNATVNNANRLMWAKNAFENPAQTAQRMLWAILAQNKASTTTQITGVTDATLQTAVDAAVDIFADGGV